VLGQVVKKPARGLSREGTEWRDYFPVLKQLSATWEAQTTSEGAHR